MILQVHDVSKILVNVIKSIPLAGFVGMFF